MLYFFRFVLFAGDDARRRYRRCSTEEPWDRAHLHRSPFVLAEKICRYDPSLTIRSFHVLNFTTNNSYVLFNLVFISRTRMQHRDRDENKAFTSRIRRVSSLRLSRFRVVCMCTSQWYKTFFVSFVSVTLFFFSFPWDRWFFGWQLESRDFFLKDASLFFVGWRIRILHNFWHLTAFGL